MSDRGPGSRAAEAEGAAFARSAACLCGAVRLRLAAPAIETYHCHCSMCRRASGSLFQTFSVYPREAVGIEGAGNLASYESSPGTHRFFCRGCGCQVYCDVESRPALRYVNTGTLEGGAHPGHPAEREAHIHVADKVPWFRIGDGLPQHERS